MSGDFGYEWAQLVKAWEAAQDEAIQARVEAAYEAGRMAEHKRNREYVADLLSGVLAQYGDISQALGASLQRFAQVQRGRRIRAERRQMIEDCRALAAAMGRPLRYVYTGGPIPLDHNGDWITNERQAQSDHRGDRQQRTPGIADDRQATVDRRGASGGQQRVIGGTQLATRPQRARGVTT